MDDLERRNGLYYKTNTGVMEHLEEFFGEFLSTTCYFADIGCDFSNPLSRLFTGNITGITQGTIRYGEKKGPWVYYYDTGQLESKATFKDGEVIAED